MVRLEHTASMPEGVSLCELPSVEDGRGLLSFGEVGSHIPFEVQRYFVVTRVPSGQVRGEHAHRAQHQFLVCVHGRCTVSADDGRHRQEIALDNPAVGLHLPPMIWSTQYGYSGDAVLLVMSSGPYDPSEYVTSYDEFLALRKL